MPSDGLENLLINLLNFCFGEGGSWESQLEIWLLKDSRFLGLVASDGGLTLLRKMREETSDVLSQQTLLVLQIMCGHKCFENINTWNMVLLLEKVRLNFVYLLQQLFLNFGMQRLLQRLLAAPKLYLQINELNMSVVEIRRISCIEFLNDHLNFFLWESVNINDIFGFLGGTHGCSNGPERSEASDDLLRVAFQIAYNWIG